MHTSNSTRAERAQAALQSYVEAKGEAFENSSSEIADLIADLLHLAFMNEHGDISAQRLADSVISLAQMHFEAEQEDPEEA